MADFLFYFLSLVAVLSGVGVVVARNPVANVLALLTAFLCMAVIYLLAGFQVIAAMQILVYAGAVMVLFLFVVMLLNLGDPDEAQRNEPVYHVGARSLPGGLVAAALLAVVALAVLGSRLSPPASIGRGSDAGGIDSAAGLARWMFGRYALPFEAVSVLLLVTAVGVLVLAKRQRPASAGSRLEDSGGAS